MAACTTGFVRVFQAFDDINAGVVTDNEYRLEKVKEGGCASHTALALLHLIFNEYRLGKVKEGECASHTGLALLHLIFSLVH